MADNEKMNEGTADQWQQGTHNEEKTFTQEEVNRIVQERLARDRRGRGSEENAEESYSGNDRERSLEERELHLMARERLFNEGLPSQLADVLKYSDEASLDEALEVIKELNFSKADAPKGKSWGQRQGSRGVSEDTKIRKAMGLDRK